MSDDPHEANGNGRSPQTVREVGFVVEGLRADIKRLDARLGGYIATHDRDHDQIDATIEANTDWRKGRQAQESLIRWLIGTNLLALVSAVVAVLAIVVER